MQETVYKKISPTESILLFYIYFGKCDERGGKRESGDINSQESAVCARWQPTCPATLWHTQRGPDTFLSTEEEKVRTEQKLLLLPTKNILFSIIIKPHCAKVHRVPATYKRQVCCVSCGIVCIEAKEQKQRKTVKAAVLPLKGSSKHENCRVRWTKN